MLYDIDKCFIKKKIVKTYLLFLYFDKMKFDDKNGC